MIKLANHFGQEETRAEACRDEEFEAFCLSLGARISAKRRESGLKVQEMSKRLGLSLSYVTLLERGARAPSLRVFLRICALFGLSPDELAEWPDCRGFFGRGREIE